MDTQRLGQIDQVRNIFRLVNLNLQENYMTPQPNMESHICRLLKNVGCFGK